MITGLFPTPPVWIASPTATLLPPPRNDNSAANRASLPSLRPSPPVIASKAKQSRGRTPPVWIASPTANCRGFAMTMPPAPQGLPLGVSHRERVSAPLRGESKPLVIASGRHIAERSNPARTPLVWIASPLRGSQ
ncbi:MAG: hypothetical protein LBT00_14745 [Spirochaetaceae bacterium]|nr:hypothetical protein [Spirochaetaceae bacterium]